MGAGSTHSVKAATVYMHYSYGTEQLTVNEQREKEREKEGWKKVVFYLGVEGCSSWLGFVSETRFWNSQILEIHEYLYICVYIIYIIHLIYYISYIVNTINTWILIDPA